MMEDSWQQHRIINALRGECYVRQTILACRLKHGNAFNKTDLSKLVAGSAMLDKQLWH